MEPRRALPSRNAPKGLRLHREQEFRENLTYDEIWEIKLEIEYELHHWRFDRRSNQDGVVKIGVQYPAGESTPSETSHFRHVVGYVNTAKYSVPIFDRNNEDFKLWKRDATSCAKHYNFVRTFKEHAEVPVGDINLDRRGLLTAGYDEEDIDRQTAAWTFFVSALRSSGDHANLHRCKTRGLIAD